MAMPVKNLLKCIALSAVVLLVVLCLGVFLMYYTPDRSPKPGLIRVACVGDSITFGLLAVPRAFNTYPAQLQKMLGEKYSVRNFGVNAHTAQKAADHSYWENEDFQSSSDYAPDIVMIMLGTNDAKSYNWKGFNTFIEDYSDMVAHYQSLPSRPTVYVMSPPRAFIANGESALRFDISKEAVDEITVGLKKFAEERNLGFIDINAITETHAEYYAFDGIHPNAAGTKLIAEAVYATLASK
jgi:lysophospholipase L1-like esterase